MHLHIGNIAVNATKYSGNARNNQTRMPQENWTMNEGMADEARTNITTHHDEAQDIRSIDKEDAIDSHDADRWFELMLNLYEQRETLTRTFLEEVYSVKGYAESTIARSDMRKTADDAFDAILRWVIDSRSDTDNRAILAHRLGIQRAQQGVPLRDLVTAISLDFKVIWRQLLAIARPEDAPLLSRNVERIWDAVDGFSRTTQIEYHNECVRLEGSQIADRTLELGNFLASHDTTAADAASIARAFGIPPDVPYCVCTGTTCRDFPAALRSIRAYSKRVVHYQKDANDWCLFWPHDVPMGAGHPLAALSTIPCCFLDGVRNLAAVPRALRTVNNFMLTVDLHGAGGPIDIRQEWARLASINLFSAFPELLESLAAKLPAVPKRATSSVTHDDADFWHVIATYLQTGSASETARQCFCHRNTVIKREQQFEECTGLNLHNPTDAALALLLLHRIGAV